MVYGRLYLYFWGGYGILNFASLKFMLNIVDCFFDYGGK